MSYRRRSVCAAAMLFVIIVSSLMFSVTASAAEDDMSKLHTVYISQNGDDKNDGSREAPLKNLIMAFNALSDEKNGAENSGGVIRVIGNNICGTYGANCRPLKSTNTIYLIGDDGNAVLDFKNSSNYDFIFSGPVVIDDVELVLGAYESSAVGRQVRFFNQGNRLEFGKGVVCETNPGSLYILGSSVSDPENGIFLYGGGFGHIWLTHEQKGTDGYLTVSENAHVLNLYSGAAGTDSTAEIHVYVTSGGRIDKLYTGGQRAVVHGDAEVFIAGGSIGAAYGTTTDSKPSDGSASLYLCVEKSFIPSTITNFDRIFYFSDEPDGTASTAVEKIITNGASYSFEYASADFTSDKFKGVSAITSSSASSDDSKPLYFIIPTPKKYEADDNFVLLSSDKKLISRPYSKGYFIFPANVWSGSGYIAYDTSSGKTGPDKSFSGASQVELPPIKQSEETSPVVPGTPEDPGETPVAPAPAGQSVDVGLIIMIVVSAVIVLTGVLLFLLKKPA